MKVSGILLSRAQMCVISSMCMRDSGKGLGCCHRLCVVEAMSCPDEFVLLFPFVHWANRSYMSNAGQYSVRVRRHVKVLVTFHLLVKRSFSCWPSS